MPVPTACCRTLPVAAALLVCAAPPAAKPAAAQKGGDDRAIPPLVVFGTKQNGVHLYGLVNKGVLVYDDGQETETYAPVDNNNTSTRFGAWLNSPVSDDLHFSANLEFEWDPYSTGRVNRLNKSEVDWETDKLRKAEGILDSRRYGRLWLGQGSMVSDGAAEADVSAVPVAYSSIGDSAGGQLLALSGGGLSDTTIASAFGNLDGVGRKVRARYDTPDMNGLRFGTSVGQDRVDGPNDTVWDMGATYDATHGDVAWQAAAAYARPAGDSDRYSGSVSALHDPTGLNVTVAVGHDRAAGDADARFVYGKLGWRADLTAVGETAFAVDSYAGSDFVIDGSESRSYGLAAVQNVDYWQVQLYATARWYDYDDAAAAYETGVAFLTGARISF